MVTVTLTVTGTETRPGAGPYAAGLTQPGSPGLWLDASVLRLATEH